MLSGSRSTKSGLDAVDRMNGGLMERRRGGEKEGWMMEGGVA